MKVLDKLTDMVGPMTKKNFPGIKSDPATDDYDIDNKLNIGDADGWTYEDELKFRDWYSQWAKKLRLDPDPDSPEHNYDYRSAYEAGAEPVKGKWPSEFKTEEHPDLIVDGVNTKTGKAIK